MHTVELVSILPPPLPLRRVVPAVDPVCAFLIGIPGADFNKSLNSRAGHPRGLRLFLVHGIGLAGPRVYPIIG
jgi:hypothetical protein